MILGKVTGSFIHPGSEVPFLINDALTEEDLVMGQDEVHHLVGDGHAKVSVSFGMSDKDFGSGFDAHVSVSLTCDQEEGVIGFAYSAASDLAAEICKDAFHRAKELYQESGG